MFWDCIGEVESGLAKILAIGLGKQRGAEGIHRFGPRNLAVWVPRVARRILDSGAVLGGLAIVENAFDQTARIEAVRPEEFEAREKELLALAKQWMARLPFDEVDVLLIDRIGKDSGEIDERTVDVWVGRLRRALAAHGVPDPLRTVRSLGYVLDSLPG